jgi:hypothetical protein
VFTTILDANNATLEIELEGAGPFNTGDAWTLFDADAFQGSFEDIILPRLPGGLQFDTSQLLVGGTLSVGGAPGEIIPEPATLVLGALAVSGLGCYVRRRKKA